MAWIGLLATVIGLWIAIDQIIKTKNAAEAASLAVSGLEASIFSRERLLELTIASGHIGAAKENIALRNFQAAIILIDVAIPQCTHAHALLGTAEKTRIQRVIVRLKKLTEKLTTNDSMLIEATVVPAALEARNIIVEINEVCALLRYQYPKEGN